jgi:hypothetical protein
MAGTKTSVWLGEDLIAQWKASGLSLTELVRRGLATTNPQPPQAVTLTGEAVTEITTAVAETVREEFGRERRRAEFD